ncbi:MAG: 5-(carboxyamino)imidazole ribonucleotide synthase [Myxococcales bacterium]|nr:5-(carboxyamino)imidazole ribonucleotide synthase [Myxococcales bacterium]
MSRARSTVRHHSQNGDIAAAATAPLLPGSTIGVLGGGQLGRMMALAARRMGYRIVVLDRNVRCPTAQVADGFVLGTLEDRDAAMYLAAQSDVITLDTEHVPADVLEALEARAPVRPGAAVLRTIQDRLTQKNFLASLGLPQAAYAPAASLGELTSAVAMVGRPSILKVRRHGYDGKGQVRITDASDLNESLRQLKYEPAVLEALVPFAREISVILARGMAGDIEVFPIAENQHRNHILHITRAPAPMPEVRRGEAIAIATRIANELGHVGVMAVEMFELPDGTLLVNEIAPRTHNSGHYTYGACTVSQFEQHVRAVCGLPLAEARQTTGAVMLNLLGDLWAHGEPDWSVVLTHPRARLHLYGKEGPAPGRKMGHVLLLDDNAERALADAASMMGSLSHQNSI